MVARADDEPFDPNKHCHDCGGVGYWPYASECDYYCKRCYTKNGYTAEITVDPDRLEQLVGRETTMLVLTMAGRATLHLKSACVSSRGRPCPVGTRVDLQKAVGVSGRLWIVDVSGTFEGGACDTVEVCLSDLEVRL